jgi:two-component sensor histidine kinase
VIAVEQPVVGLRIHAALEASGIGVWEWEPASGTMFIDEFTRSLCGLPGTALNRKGFLAALCVDDRPLVQTELMHAIADRKLHSIECRLADSQHGARWIVLAGRTFRLQDGTVTVTGTAREITQRKQLDIAHELAMREMEHRVINTLSVVTALVSLLRHRANTSDELAGLLLTRIGALTRLQRSLRASDLDCVTLRQVIENELSPFERASDTFHVDGPAIEMGPAQTLAITLIVHELAANAVRHGALGRPEGQLEVRWSIERSHAEECLLLQWKERCTSAPLKQLPMQQGLGSRLLLQIARLQLGGDISLQLEADGLRATLVVPITHLNEAQA